MEETFGNAPYFRFRESSWPGATEAELYEVCDRAPRGLLPEEKCHWLQKQLPLKKTPTISKNLQHLRQIYQEEGPFECILGYSEGASVAATFVIDLFREVGSDASLKCAVFINGTPPFNAEGDDIVLADKNGQVIDIPTCHVMAYNDTLRDFSVALFNLCNGDVASIIDHGKAHYLPRDIRSCRLISQGIKGVFCRAGLPTRIVDQE